jgi:hypothetical protein
MLKNLEVEKSITGVDTHTKVLVYIHLFLQIAENLDEAEKICKL